MDPKAIEYAVQFLLENGLDVVVLLHDNDSTGIKAARATKKKFIADHPFNYLTTGMEEELCIRHGGMHAGKDFINLGRSLLPKDKVRLNGKSSGPFSWGCSDRCKKYITTVFRKIVYMNDTVEGLKSDFEHFLNGHLLGDHGNSFCAKYGKCHSSDTPRLDGQLYGEALKDFRKRWCNIDMLKKYLNCRDTNFEESSNCLMISLYPKRLFGSSGVPYDVAAHTIPLMLNCGGWNFIKLLYAELRLEVPPVLAKVVDQIEAKYYKKALRQATQKYKNRVVMLKKLRTGQYLKNQRGVQHGKLIRKHDGSGSGNRRCGYCRREGLEVYSHRAGSKCPFFNKYSKKATNNGKTT